MMPVSLPIFMFMKRVSALPLDYKTTVILYVMLPVLFRWRGLALNYEWTDFFIPFWLGVALYSVFAAALFHLIENGVRKSFWVAFKPLAGKKVRLIFLTVLVLESTWLMGFWNTLIISSDILAVVVFVVHLRSKTKDWIKDALTALIPAFYFSAGFILIASYNVLIGSARYFAAYDSFFNSLDKLFLSGWSVTELSQQLAFKASPLVFLFLEKIYFFMFPQIGAAIILLTVQKGTKHALRFVGTIAIAYQLATLIYFFFPSLGPFFLSRPVSAGLPPHLVTTHIQAELVQKLELLWQTGTKSSIGLDFYIAFPCMHLAQPLIVLWFLRFMKRVFWALAAYDFLMLFSIIFLQWHYLVDLLGGLFVALIAIKVYQLELKRVSSRTMEVQVKSELVGRSGYA